METKAYETERDRRERMENMVLEVLAKIQSELKAPKGQYNGFGKYKFRSCEDILEALKPLLTKYECTMTLSDDVILIGERYYIKATATLYHNGGSVTNTAFAREDLDKKGMDDSQITGTASSYARKYCLNGLFLIDDTKDADTEEYRKEKEARAEAQNKAPETAEAQNKAKEEDKPITPAQIETLVKIARESGKELDEEAVKGWTMKRASEVIASHLKRKKEDNKNG